MKKLATILTAAAFLGGLAVTTGAATTTDAGNAQPYGGVRVVRP